VIDWEGILRRDGPMAWKSAWKVVGNRADADECFQEACLSALEYSRTHAVRHWRALLQRFATARAIDRLRQRIRLRNRESELPPDRLADNGTSPLDKAQNAELGDRLRRALTQLSPTHAEAFCLFHMSGWKYTEIAESMQVSVDLVGVWLQRARSELRKSLSASDTKSGVSS
jgi:RNA polymerase sigma-70 factor (ECF subfamily)